MASEGAQAINRTLVGASDDSDYDGDESGSTSSSSSSSIITNSGEEAVASLSSSRNKVVVVGDDGVGKKWLIQIDPASLAHVQTCGWTIDTKYYSADLDFWIVNPNKVRISDAVTAHLGVDCQALILVFDLNDVCSFEIVCKWVSFIESFNPEVMLCVGNRPNVEPGAAAAAASAVVPAAAGTNEEKEKDIRPTQKLNTVTELLLSGDEWSRENGLEFVDVQWQGDVATAAETNNDEPNGVPRIIQALQCNMWRVMSRKKMSTATNSRSTNNSRGAQVHYGARDGSPIGSFTDVNSSRGSIDSGGLFGKPLSSKPTGSLLAGISSSDDYDDVNDDEYDGVPEGHDRIDTDANSTTPAMEQKSEPSTNGCNRAEAAPTTVASVAYFSSSSSCVAPSALSSLSTNPSISVPVTTDLSPSPSVPRFFGPEPPPQKPLSVAPVAAAAAAAATVASVKPVDPNTSIEDMLRALGGADTVEDGDVEEGDENLQTFAQMIDRIKAARESSGSVSDEVRRSRAAQLALEMAKIFQMEDDENQAEPEEAAARATDSDS